MAAPVSDDVHRLPERVLQVRQCELGDHTRNGGILPEIVEKQHPVVTVIDWLGVLG